MFSILNVFIFICDFIDFTFLALIMKHTTDDEERSKAVRRIFVCVNQI